MSSPFSDRLVTRIGNARGAPCASALANLARHTSRDTILVASSTTRPFSHGDAGVDHLNTSDIDGLSTVVDTLRGRDLDLVLHGSSSGLDAAAELVALLRGRYDSVRALVPEAALSALSLIALVCDTVIMPDTALLGATAHPYDPQITPVEARDWMHRHRTGTDRFQRLEFATAIFGEEEDCRGPITAAHARELGLQIHLVGNRSGIGSDLVALGQPIGNICRADGIVRLIENHRGTYYAVTE